MDPSAFFNLVDTDNSDDDDLNAAIPIPDDAILVDPGVVASDDSDGDSDGDNSDDNGGDNDDGDNDGDRDMDAAREAFMALESDNDGDDSDAEAPAPGEMAGIVPLNKGRKGIEKVMQERSLVRLCEAGIEAAEDNGAGEEAMTDDQCDVGAILDSCVAGLIAAATVATEAGTEGEEGDKEATAGDEEKKEGEVLGATAAQLVRALFYAEAGSSKRFRAAFRAVAVPCPVCKEQWNTPTLTYTCYDCQKDPSAVMCKDCFDFRLHEGHRYVSVMAYSGCCDCGDPTAWDPATFCAKHGAQHALSMDELVARAPQPYAARTVAALRTVFARVVACLEEHSPRPEADAAETLTDAARTARAAAIAAVSAALCVVEHTMRQEGEVLCALVARALSLPPAAPVREVASAPDATETVANTSVLDYILSYAHPRPLGRMLSDVVYPLIHMPGFRPLVATTLARHYVWAAERFTPLDKYYNGPSVQRYLVQLATVPVSFGSAMPYPDALRCLFRALGHVFRKVPVRVLESGARKYLMTPDCLVSAERVISDATMISQTHHFRECLAAHPDLAVELQTVLWDAAAPFQFAVVIPKKFGEHILHDKPNDIETATLMTQVELFGLWSEVWPAAGTAVDQSSSSLSSSSSSLAPLLRHFGELAERAQKTLRRQYEWDAASGLIRFDGRSVTTFFPMQMLLSIAAFALVARGAAVESLFASCATGARTEQVLLMLEEPLRLFAVSAQASARLWVRNGTSLAFLLMLFTHGNIVLIRNIFFALQLAAAILPPEVFVQTYLAHMTSGATDTDNNDSGKGSGSEGSHSSSSSGKGTIPAVLFTEALATLVTVATDKTLLPNVTPEESGKRLVVQLLANKKQASFAGISKALSPSDKTIPWLEAYIRTVADYTPPRGSHDGSYRLKPAVLEHFAPYSTFYFGVATAEYEEQWTAFLRRTKRRAASPTPPCPARADLPTGDFAGLPRVLNTTALWDFVCGVLESPAVADFTDRTYVVLCHLLQLGLHEGVTLTALNERHRKVVTAFLETAANESNEHAKTMRALLAELSGGHSSDGSSSEGAQKKKPAALSKMELAKQKQQAMLAAMKQKQALLLQHFEDEDDDSDEDATTGAGGAAMTKDGHHTDGDDGEPEAKKKNGACDECCDDDLNSCVLCHEDAGDLGYIGMVQYCSLPLYCAMHSAGAVAKEGREARRGAEADRLPFEVGLDPVLTTCQHKVHAKCFRAFAASRGLRDHQTFLCPACRQLSNVVVSPHADFFPALSTALAHVEAGSTSMVFLRVLTATLLHRELVLRDTCPALDSAAAAAAAIKDKDAGFLRCVLRCAVAALPAAQADTILGFTDAYTSSTRTGDSDARAKLLHTAALVDPFFHAVSLVVALLRRHGGSDDLGAASDPLPACIVQLDSAALALLFAQQVVRVLVCAHDPALASSSPEALAAVVTEAMTSTSAGASEGKQTQTQTQTQALLQSFARNVFLLLHHAGMLPAGASGASFAALSGALGLAVPAAGDIAVLARETAAQPGELHAAAAEPFALRCLPASFTELMVRVREARAQWGCPAAHTRPAVCVGCGGVFCRDCVALSAMYQHADRCLGCLVLLDPDDQSILASSTDRRTMRGIPFVYQDCHGASHLTGLPLYLSPERTAALRDCILHLNFNNMLRWLS